MSQHAFHSLSDEEFLRLISRQRHQSPLIEELCSRLESFLDSYNCNPQSFQEILDATAMLSESLSKEKKQLSCPTCEAVLTLKIYPEEEHIELKHIDAF
jgi:hypothetical protein